VDDVIIVAQFLQLSQICRLGGRLPDIGCYVAIVNLIPC
jgi:hypothetical protein